MSCLETYSTLRIFSDEITPEEISKTLGIEPTKSFRKGDVHNRGKLRRKAHGWFYCTQGLSESRDSQGHLDMILNALHGKEGQIKDLQTRGCQMDIFNYWDSSGQGGPWLMPDQMLRLGALNIEIGWDIYFSSEDKT